LVHPRLLFPSQDLAERLHAADISRLVRVQHCCAFPAAPRAVRWRTGDVTGRLSTTFRHTNARQARAHLTARMPASPGMDDVQPSPDTPAAACGHTDVLAGPPTPPHHLPHHPPIRPNMVAPRPTHHTFPHCLTTAHAGRGSMAFTDISSFARRRHARARADARSYRPLYSINAGPVRLTAPYTADALSIRYARR